MAKISLHVLVGWALVLCSVNAYQELREPDVVRIGYPVEDRFTTIKMYESAANALIENVGGSCFQRTDDLTNPQKREYRLLNTENCSNHDGLFFKMLKFYQEAVNASPDEITMGMVDKHGGTRVIIDGARKTKALYVRVDVIKDIITTFICS